MVHILMIHTTLSMPGWNVLFHLSLRTHWPQLHRVLCLCSTLPILILHKLYLCFMFQYIILYITALSTSISLFYFYDQNSPIIITSFFLLKRGSECKSTWKNNTLQYLEYENCTSTERNLKVKYCSTCKKYKCCGPGKTKTVEFDFTCKDTGQKKTHSFMWLRTCTCYPTRRCPFYRKYK
jgi:hypothetical protein